MFQNSSYSLYDSLGSRKYHNVIEREEFSSHLDSLPFERKVFCLVLLNTDVRISEALSVCANNIDVQSNLLFIESLKKRKRGKFRAIPISANLTLLLSKLTKMQGKGKLFTLTRRTGYRIVKKSLNSLGISGIHACPKGLRHSFAIFCLLKNIPLTLIQKWMGHSSLSVTAIYLQVSSKEEYQLASRLWE